MRGGDLNLELSKGPTFDTSGSYSEWNVEELKISNLHFDCLKMSSLKEIYIIDYILKYLFHFPPGI